MYEAQWREWVDVNRTELRQTSARHLVEAFGLHTIDTDTNLELKILLQPMSALRDRGDKLEAKRLEKKLAQGRKFARQPAYSWWLALTVLKSRLRRDAVDKFTAEAISFFERSSREMGSVDDFTRPVTSWDAATAFAATATEQFQHGSNAPLLVMAVIFHFQHAIEEFGMIDYRYLGEDLHSSETNRMTTDSKWLPWLPGASGGISTVQQQGHSATLPFHLSRTPCPNWIKFRKFPSFWGKRRCANRHQDDESYFSRWHVNPYASPRLNYVVTKFPEAEYISMSLVFTLFLLFLVSLGSRV